MSKCAAKSWTKAKLVEWLLMHNAVDANGEPYTEEVLKKIKNLLLYEMCRQRKPPKQFLLLDWVTLWNATHGTDIRVNYLPVAHPQLNPIEMMWNWLKSYVRRENKNFS